MNKDSHLLLSVSKIESYITKLQDSYDKVIQDLNGELYGSPADVQEGYCNSLPDIELHSIDKSELKESLLRLKKEIEVIGKMLLS